MFVSKTIIIITVIALISGIAAGVVVAKTETPTTYHIAINPSGQIRLLSPDVNGNYNEQLKKNETLIELPSMELITMLDSRVAEIEGRVDGLADIENRLNALEISDGDQDSKIANLESMVIELESRLTGLESLGNSVADLNIRLAAIESLGSTVADLNSRLTTLESLGNSVADLNSRLIAIESLESLVADLNSRLTALENGNPGNPIDTNLVLYLPMNEGGGSTVGDLSSYDNNGIIYGASWTGGVDGYALSFNGSNAHVDVGNMSILDIADLKITIEAWIKTTATAPNTSQGMRVFTDYRDPTGSRISLGIRGNKVSSYAYPQGSFYGTSAINDGNWHHIVTTYNGTTQKLYVDGKEENSRDFDLVDTFCIHPDFIGSYTATQSTNSLGNFNGGIDEVRIYNRALSAEEVLNHYLATKL